MKLSPTTGKLINISLFLIILLLLLKLSPIFKPFMSIFKFFVIPIVLAIYVFYALNPLKQLLSKRIQHKTLVSVTVFILFLVALILFITFVSSFLIVQIKNLSTTLNYENFVKNNEIWINSLPEWIDIDALLEKLATNINLYVNNLPSRLKGITASVGSVASGIGSVGTQIIIFLLATYYLLADEGKIRSLMQNKALNKPYASTFQNAIRQIHSVLSTYITGQLFVSLILGALMFLGFVIIGLPYAGLMAIINIVTNLIPFVGPFIGGIPAILLGLTHSWILALEVLVVILVVQQIESNFISPQVIGSRLAIHPFTVIIVVLAGMQLFGVIGSLIGTPLYMTIRIIISSIIDYNKIRKKAITASSPDNTSSLL